MSTSQKRPIVFGLMTVLLVAGMAMLAGCGAGPTVQTHPTATSIPPTATASPTHPAGPVITVPITSVTMFSTTVGWGQVQANSGSDDQPIAYTVDGGRTWYGVTPASYSFDRYRLIAFYSRSSTEAWILASLKGSNTSVFLWHTTDAGAHWTSRPAVLASPLGYGIGVPRLEFVDSLHGWFTFPPPEGDYTGHTPLDLWHTADGGATWTRVAHAIALSHTVGVSFANATTGFATGYDVGGGGLLITMTHDAGYTWADAASLLPLPGDYVVNGGMSDVEPPVFTSATDGVLMVIYPTHTAAKLALYRTTDAGSTWTLGPTLAGVSFPNGAFSFLTSVTAMDEVVVATAASNGSVALYDLPVGASSWTQIQTSSGLLTGITQVDFLDLTHGWAVTKAGLIGTTDGGMTWAVLHAHPSGPFQVTTVTVTVDPASIDGMKCGTFTVVKYTAMFHLAPNGAEGAIHFWYTINNGRGQNGDSVTVAPGQIVATYLFEWAGNLPADHSYPQPGGVLVFSPNGARSNFAMPSGQCH